MQQQHVHPVRPEKHHQADRIKQPIVFNMLDQGNTERVIDTVQYQPTFWIVPYFGLLL
jgi:hypothetical protein